MSRIFPRCRIVPLADHQVSVQIDGNERTRWHFGTQYPRPFFFPVNGPSGESLTRMGHPGASNHDHHRSVWFAHNKLLGIDFWSDNTDARIRQKEWLVYEDGDDRAILATRLGWYDGHEPKELVDQMAIVIFRPEANGETLIELQSIFHPTADTIEFQQTNFGFLAVRVARSISEHFGGGKLTSSEGLVGEKDGNGKPNIFGKQARWMDYSGPVLPGAETADGDSKTADTVEGITYFDHPDNPGFPNYWHVREDGWMGASPCMHGPLQTTRAAPLRLRFLLHAHAGPIDPARAETIAKQFATWPAFDVIKSTKSHQQYEIREL
ncbi:MAG: PmoA family protein [Rhodopirellula sp.]|nr:PmoA family protein [Rhodopirellula sp.]